MSPNDADGMADCSWSGSALFAQAYLSENLGSLWYLSTRSCIPTFKVTGLLVPEKKIF